MEEAHHCDNNFYNDIRIQYQQINAEQWSWVLDYTWRATQDEVNVGFASKIGGEIMSDRLLISYCPFCGCNLIDIRKNTW